MPSAAGLIGTDQTVAMTEERERIRDFLSRDDVQIELQNRGVDAESAKARVDSLSDAEVQQIAGKMDELPAAGDFFGFVLVVFLVLLITDVLGFTKIFPFTKPVR